MATAEAASGGLAPPTEVETLPSKTRKDMAAEDEAPDLELGDRIFILGGKLDGTRGRIYYMDGDLIRILPDGVSDRLVDIPIVDGDFDPSLEIQRTYLITKRADPAFVAQIDAQKGYLAETFGPNGEPGTTYTIESVDEENDTLVLVDETGGRLEDVVEPFIGLNRDIPFSVLRPRQPPDAEGAVGLAEDEAAAAAAVAEDEAAENTGFENVDFEAPPAAAPDAEEARRFAVVEEAESMKAYSDEIQRGDAFLDFLAQLTAAAQKNPRKQKVIRQLVEQCLLLRNEIVAYSSTGDVEGAIPTSFQTVGELLDTVDVPLARPVLDAQRSVYFDIGKYEGINLNPATIPDRDIDVHYIYHNLRQSNTFLESTLGAAPEAAAAAADSLPAWYLSWEAFFKRYLRSWLSNSSSEAAGDQIIFRADKEFFRAPVPKEDEADVDGLEVGTKGRPEDVTKLPFSLLKGVGPRSLRLRTNEDPQRVETGDEGVMTNQLLFPLSTQRDLGSTRSGSIARDVTISHKPANPMKTILASLGSVPEEPTAGGILSIGVGGNTTGNISIEEWLRAQPLRIFGLGEALADLKHMGLTQKELSVDQQEILVEKIRQIRALLNDHITGIRDKSKQALGALRLEALPFLQGEALEEFMASLATEPLLAKEVEEIKQKLPAYKDTDIAMFAALNTTMGDLLMATLAGVPAPLARERTRRVRDTFLESLHAALAKLRKKEMTGEIPKPIDCIHVNDLETIRKVKRPEERMALLSSFLGRYKREVKDNWVMCSQGDHRLICYHEALLLDEYNYPREKETIHKELLLAFSGGQFHGNYMCKNCGQPIAELDYDRGMEFDDEGRPMGGRGEMVDRDAIAQEQIEQALGAPAEGKEQVEWDTEQQTLIYKTAKEILNQVGIYAERDDFKRIIGRVESELAKQPSRAEYAAALKARAAKDPKAATRAPAYDVLINRVMVSAVAAHVLIEIQTHIPDFIPRYRLPGCRASFTGFPLGPEKDRSGLEYIACAVASIKRNEPPWNLTGFLTIGTEKGRQEQIIGGVAKLAAEAMSTAAVQQLVTAKRAHLERIYGSAVLGDHIPEAVPPGFKPVPYAVKEEEATEAVVVPDAATPEERARAWIQTGHRLARQNGTYIAGSPFSETSCCFGPVSQPAAFWAEKEGAMPALDDRTPPEGAHNSQVMVHFSPRRAARLLADPPEDLFYRVFLRVCYDGPRKGLPHEPGYTNICPHCGFVFAESPYVETPAPPFSIEGKKSKEMFAEWESEMAAIITRGKGALEAQRIVVNRETFQDLLDASHKAFSVELPVVERPQTGVPLLDELGRLTPEPFQGWRKLVAETIARVSTLPPAADDLSVGEAYGPLSDFVVTTFADLQRQLGPPTAAPIKALLEKSPAQVAESLRAYIQVPFKRLLNGFKTSSLFIQKSYELPEITYEAIEKAMATHLNYVPLSKLIVGAFPKLKMTKMVAALEQLLPLFQNSIRPQLLPGGARGTGYLVGAAVLGLFGEFLNQNVIPDMGGAGGGGAAAVGGVGGTLDPGSRAPIGILSACLTKFQSEGLALTEDEIRNIVAQREEEERRTFISQFDRLDPEQKKMALMIKRLGLKEWAIGGTKAIYSLDPELLEREKARREEMGIIDFADDQTQQAFMAGYMGRMPGGGDGEGGEGGYDVAQMGADDF